MLLLISIQQFDFGSKLILAILFAALFGMMIYYSFKMIEMVRVMRNKKPFYTHFYLVKRKLTSRQKNILEQQFSFYKKLSSKEKSFFEHRVASFIKDKTFIGRKELEITDEIRVLISATAVMLTFGFRDFYIGLIDKILIYPSAFYSTTNEDYHKGEFNPKLKALALSWEDFLKGFEIENDNLNLGIHEFTHAIHLNSIKERDVSSIIFKDSFKELMQLLTNDELLRNRLLESDYFREYAYTNRFEFIAVLIEHFIETPHELRSQFPELYALIKQMLNFNYNGY